MTECYNLRDSTTGATARVLTGYGFNCFSFVARDEQGDVELLWSEEDFESGDKRPSGSGIPILFPFPGRLPGMTFSWNGQSYPLESDDGRGNGIHGFVHRRSWRIVDASETSVVGQFQASLDDPALLSRWPADFRIQASYRLAGNTLQCEMTLFNPDSKPLPCGLGSHPYFRLPLGEGASGRCRVRAPASHQWRLDAMLPTGERVDAAPPLAEFQSFDGLTLDSVFTGLTFRDGWFRAEIEDEHAKRRVVVAFDGVFRECVVYTPPHREAICIEPYTCVPGAAGRDDFDHGWMELAPGETCTGRMHISLEAID